MCGYELVHMSSRDEGSRRYSASTLESRGTLSHALSDPCRALSQTRSRRRGWSRRAASRRPSSRRRVCGEAAGERCSLQQVVACHLKPGRVVVGERLRLMPVEPCREYCLSSNELVGDLLVACHLPHRSLGQVALDAQASPAACDSRDNVDGRTPLSAPPPGCHMHILSNADCQAVSPRGPSCGGPEVSSVFTAPDIDNRGSQMGCWNDGLLGRQSVGRPPADSPARVWRLYWWRHALQVYCFRSETVSDNCRTRVSSSKRQYIVGLLERGCAEEPQRTLQVVKQQFPLCK